MFAGDNGVLQGTLELLILKAVSLEPAHGYEIARWIETTTDEVLRVEDGSLYPALYRMSKKGWIKGEWGTSENNRRAKYYRLTAEGERQLRDQGTGWRRLALAVTQALDSADTPAPERAG